MPINAGSMPRSLRERVLDPYNIETLFYRVDARVDELKQHFIPGTKITCQGGSGIVRSTENGGRRAKIECELCRGTVDEEV